MDPKVLKLNSLFVEKVADLIRGHAAELWVGAAFWYLEQARQLCMEDEEASSSGSSGDLSEEARQQWRLPEAAGNCARPPTQAASRHMRQLNNHFCDWVDWAEQHAPDELWDDGVQNYLRSGNQLLARHDDDSSSCGSGAGGSPVMAGPLRGFGALNIGSTIQESEHEGEVEGGDGEEALGAGGSAGGGPALEMYHMEICSAVKKYGSPERSLAKIERKLAEPIPGQGDDWPALLEHMNACGWEYKAQNDHYKFHWAHPEVPGFGRVTSVPCTPSDRRALRNVAARLRKEHDAILDAVTRAWRAGGGLGGRGSPGSAGRPYGQYLHSPPRHQQQQGRGRGRGRSGGQDIRGRGGRGASGRGGAGRARPIAI